MHQWHEPDSDAADDSQAEACARLALVLGTFEAADIAALGGVASERVGGLLGHQLTFDGAFRLTQAAARAVRATLRRDAPRLEIALHERALAYRVDRGHDAATWLPHLLAIHDQSIEWMDWLRIMPHIERCRNQQRGAPLADWYTFFAAHAALRDGDPAAIDALAPLAAHPDPALRERSLHALGIGRALAGSYAEALPYWEAADQIASERGDLARMSYLQLSLGMAANDLEQFAQALSYSRRSLALAERADEVYRAAHARYEIGNNALYLGLWDEAAASLAEAESFYRAVGMDNRLAMVAWGHGTALQMHGTGEAEAEHAFRLAADRSLANASQVPLVGLDALASLGALYATRGDLAAAEQTYVRAIEVAERHRLRHWTPIYRGMLASLLAARGERRAALALYFTAISEIESLRAGQGAEAIRISLFATTQYIYQRVMQLLLDLGQNERAFAIAERARSRAFLDQAARDEAASRHPHRRARPAHPLVRRARVLGRRLGPPQRALPTVQLREVQRLLAPGDLLLAYVTTGVLPTGDHWLNRIARTNPRLLAHVTPPPEIVLFAIEATGLRVHRIAADPNRLRHSPRQIDPGLATLRSHQTLRALYDTLLAPVADRLARARRLMIVPHGPLHAVPFPALCDPSGRYLLEGDGPALSLAPSATILARRCLAKPARAGGVALAIGYNDPAGANLAYAEHEARVVARLTGGSSWVGPEPKREFLAALPDLRLLHIAAHAEVDHAHPLRSAVLLGDGDLLDAATVLDRLRLDAELVTLSACMSGYSAVIPGDELMGLLRAFLIAGARSVVCAQTRTPDAVAYLTMVRFYELLSPEISPAVALRDAVTAVRRMPRRAALDALAALGYAQPDWAGDDDDALPFAAPECWGGLVCIGRP